MLDKGICIDIAFVCGARDYVTTLTLVLNSMIITRYFRPAMIICISFLIINMIWRIFIEYITTVSIMK